MWKLKTPAILIISLTLLMSLSVGCGARIPAGSDVESPAPSETTTPAPLPTEEPTPEPTVAPTPVPSGQLRATLQSVKDGLLGMGSIEATVLVVNDTQSTLSGELRVQFTDNGKADPAHLQTMQVTLQGGEQKTYIFRDKTWAMDNATVEIANPQASTTYSSGYGASYNF